MIEIREEKPVAQAVIRRINEAAFEQNGLIRLDSNRRLFTSAMNLLDNLWLTQHNGSVLQPQGKGICSDDDHRNRYL